MNWQRFKVSIRTSVRAATETEEGRGRFAFHICMNWICEIYTYCMYGMFHCTVRAGGGPEETADLGTCGERRREGEVGEGSGRPPGLDRFQWNRRLGGAEARVMVRVERLIGGWGGQVRDL